MASVAELQAYRDALLKALGSGERAIEYDGKRVEFRNPAELREAIAAVDREIASLGSSRLSEIRFATSKGL